MTENPAVQAATPAQSGHFSDKKRGYGYMWILSITIAGMSSVDWVTSNYLPITLRMFTDSSLAIAILLSLNRLFGFVVQPYVTWKSDHIHSRFGRRRPFFLIGNPMVLFSLLAIGAMPYLFKEGYRSAILAMGLLILFNVLLQFFQDFAIGCTEPLYADTFEQKTLGRASAIRTYSVLAVAFLMNFAALPLADKSEIAPYAFSGALVLVAFLVMFFFVRERHYVPQPPGRYNPVAHFSLLRNREYFLLAVIGGLGLCLAAATALYNALFITQTLGLTKTDMGLAIGFSPVAAFLFSFPFGYLADRYGPQYVLAFGFLAHAVANAAMAFWVDDFQSLLIITLFNAGMGVAGQVSMTAMIFQYASPSDRGTVFGLVQFVRGFSAFVITLVLGGLVQMSRSYDATPIYPLDVKDPVAMAQRIENPDTSFERYLNASIPAEMSDRLRQTKNREALQKDLAAQLNVWMQDQNLYAPDRVQHAEMSRQSRRMLARQHDTDALKVLNRSLLQDAFREELSAKANYRISYVVNILLSLFAAVLALYIRKGKYAQTILDE